MLRAVSAAWSSATLRVLLWGGVSGLGDGTECVSALTSLPLWWTTDVVYEERGMMDPLSTLS
jgi:hypothetical protein